MLTVYFLASKKAAGCFVTNTDFHHQQTFMASFQAPVFLACRAGAKATIA
jgi:protein tyrosine phosphatase (PTP) superfamily phosphohydrolase (DUF442 family)